MADKNGVFNQSNVNNAPKSFDTWILFSMIAVWRKVNKSF